MAKAKPTSNSNAKVKKVVSTKGIFKHAKPRQWYRENVNLREDGTQRATGRLRASKQRKSLQTPVHPLATTFSSNAMLTLGCYFR